MVYVEYRKLLNLTAYLQTMPLPNCVMRFFVTKSRADVMKSEHQKMLVFQKNQ